MCTPLKWGSTNYHTRNPPIPFHHASRLVTKADVSTTILTVSTSIPSIHSFFESVVSCETLRTPYGWAWPWLLMGLIAFHGHLSFPAWYHPKRSRGHGNRNEPATSEVTHFLQARLKLSPFRVPSKLAEIKGNAVFSPLFLFLLVVDWFAL